MVSDSVKKVSSCSFRTASLASSS